MTFLPSKRITIFVPRSKAEEFMLLIEDHVPSFLGHYDRVLWCTDLCYEEGVEQFRPLSGSNPSAGVAGKTQKEAMTKIEFSMPDNIALCMQLIETVLIPSHPWEEPVIVIADTHIYAHQK